MGFIFHGCYHGGYTEVGQSLPPIFPRGVILAGMSRSQDISDRTGPKDRGMLSKYV